MYIFTSSALDLQCLYGTNITENQMSNSKTTMSSIIQRMRKCEQHSQGVYHCIAQYVCTHLHLFAKVCGVSV